MKIFKVLSLTLFFTSFVFAETWEINNQADWKKNIQSSKGIIIEDGLVSPKEKTGHFKTKLKKFKTKKSLQSLTLNQSPVWQNWEEVPGVGPSNLGDAPVFLAKGPKDYWMFGRYKAITSKKGQNSAKFTPQDAKARGIRHPP